MRSQKISIREKLAAGSEKTGRDRQQGMLEITRDQHQSRRLENGLDR